MLSSVTDLLRYIDENQLTSEFGGTLDYCHSDWIVLRTVRNRYVHAVKLNHPSSSCSCFPLASEVSPPVDEPVVVYQFDKL